MNKSKLESILNKIKDERVRQDFNWGEHHHIDLKWLAILGEEFGEVAECCNEDTPTGPRLWSEHECKKQLKKELIQVAAVCVAWLESLKD